MWNIPRSGLIEITPRAQKRFIEEVIKEPTTTSKQLQTSFASAKVHDSTVRNREKKWHPWLSSKVKPFLTFVKNILIIPLCFSQFGISARYLFVSHTDTSMK